MKKTDIFLKDYVARLNLDTLKYLSIRLDERISSDLAEAMDVFSSCSDLDKWLSSAKSCDELYDMVDLVQEYVEREVNKRSPEMVRA